MRNSINSERVINQKEAPSTGIQFSVNIISAIFFAFLFVLIFFIEWKSNYLIIKVFTAFFTETKKQQQQQQKTIIIFPHLENRKLWSFYRSLRLDIMERKFSVAQFDLELNQIFINLFTLIVQVY